MSSSGRRFISSSTDVGGSPIHQSSAAASLPLSIPIPELCPFAPECLQQDDDDESSFNSNASSSSGSASEEDGVDSTDGAAGRCALPPRCFGVTRHGRRCRVLGGVSSVWRVGAIEIYDAQWYDEISRPLIEGSMYCALHLHQQQGSGMVLSHQGAAA